MPMYKHTNMKKLITTDIIDPVKAPFKKAALDNLQDNFTEIPAAIIEALIGPSYDPNLIYILNGVNFTLSTTSTANDTLTWTKGAIYLYGEVFQVAADSVVKTADTWVFKIVDNITNATFSDGNTYPWIENKTITLIQGVHPTDGAGYNSAGILRLLDWNGNVAFTSFATGWTSEFGKIYYTYNRITGMKKVWGFVTLGTFSSIIVCTLPSAMFAYGTSEFSATHVERCAITSGGTGYRDISIDNAGVIKIDSSSADNGYHFRFSMTYY